VQLFTDTLVRQSQASGLNVNLLPLIIPDFRHLVQSLPSVSTLQYVAYTVSKNILESFLISTVYMPLGSPDSYTGLQLMLAVLITCKVFCDFGFGYNFQLADL